MKMILIKQMETESFVWFPFCYVSFVLQISLFSDEKKAYTLFLGIL